MAKQSLSPNRWIPTVRFKLFVFLCAVSLLPMFLASRMLISLGSRSARTLAEMQIRDGVEQTLQAIAAAQARLQEGVTAVAAWQDLEKFMIRPDAAWAQGSLASWAPQTYRLDYLAICAASGKPLYEWRAACAAGEPILDSLLAGPADSASGLISTQRQIFLVARRDITANGKPAGMLVFGRQMTHQFLNEIKTGRNNELTLYYGDRLLATTDTSVNHSKIDPRDIFPNLVAHREIYLYHGPDPDQHMGFQPLRNLRGLEIAALGWMATENPSTHIAEAIDKLLLFSGIPLLFLILLSALVLGLWIERPIRTLSNLMERIRQTGDLTQRAMVAGGGEIASMSRTLNDMLEQLEVQRDELLTFRTMILTMREGVVIENARHGVTYMNPRMEELLGIRFADYQNAEEPLILEDRMLSRRLIHTDEREFKTEEITWERPEGRRVQALRTSGRLEDPEGRFSGQICTFVDITERNELELELIQASRMAFLGVYSQGIIHNLNGPLNSVLGFSTLLCRNLPEDEIPRRIKCDAQRMAAMVVSLANRWKRASASEREPLNLNEIILEELSFLEADLFFKHNVEKELDLAPDLPVLAGVYGDFSHAILNILINSIEAMGESPVHKIAIRTRHDERELRVEIEDSGVGISPEDMNRIFLPFFSTKDRDRKDGIPSGAGLGLSIARKVLEPYRIRFEVRSEPRLGTNMILHIPRDGTAPVAELQCAHEEVDECLT